MSKRIPDPGDWREGLDPSALNRLMLALALADVQRDARAVQELNERQEAQYKHLLLRAWASRGADPASPRERSPLSVPHTRTDSSAEAAEDRMKLPPPANRDEPTSAMKTTNDRTGTGTSPHGSGGSAGTAM
jgi:hypothetical protein